MTQDVRTAVDFVNRTQSHRPRRCKRGLLAGQCASLFQYSSWIFPVATAKPRNGAMPPYSGSTLPAVRILENNAVVYTSLAHRKRHGVEATRFTVATVVLVILARRVRARAETASKALGNANNAIHQAAPAVR